MKLVVLIIFSALLASLLHTFKWERDARQQWRELAKAVQEEAGR